jgi:pyruvate,water dikinase
LHDSAATDAALVGAKAANLARAAAAGLPVLPGFALTTNLPADGMGAPTVAAAVRSAWTSLSHAGELPLVVRSSSIAEDTSTSSMAGQFTSVLGVRGWDGFLRAVDTVLGSAAHPHSGSPDVLPMGVLVQPHLEADCGGVLFGLDPVSGDRRHVIVEVVRGSPDALVSGRATAAHAVLGWRGRLAGGGGPEVHALLGRSRRIRLSRLAHRSARAFDGPQDVEWAFDRDDQLWLLQSRDVTATGAAAEATGPVLGPGPVAETFPAPLHPLELDLWVDPLRRAVASAIHVTGARSRSRIDRSPVVCGVGGRVAADLELFGIVPSGGAGAQLLHPLRAARRLTSAWRVGRLRAALPALAADLLAQADTKLAAVGDLDDLDDHALVDLLELASEELVALYGHEVLAGMLLDERDRPSLAVVALAALARSREAGLDDELAIHHAPVLLALSPPAIAAPEPLPSSVPAELAGRRHPLGELSCRDALRLRSRWVQELSARAAGELGQRLAAAGRITAPELVRELHVRELRLALGGELPADLEARAATRPGPPLPMAFRLAPSNLPVSEAGRHAAPGDGLAASGGRSTGTVCHDPAAIQPGRSCVLVVDTLDPRLAAVLPDLAGLVSETGSALSHLAILARELQVPAVVAVPGARQRFPQGSQVLVDGASGEVRLLGDGEQT